MPHTKQKIVLSIASLASIGIIGVNVLAADGYTIINPSTATWANARTVEISGGYTTTNTAITLNIDNSKASSNYFLDYEGVDTEISGNPTHLSSELYIDPSWDVNVRVSFWGYGYNSMGTLASYNIIEYTNITDQSELDYIKNHNSTGGDISATCAANACSYAPGWNVFDDDTGVWHNLPGVSSVPGIHTLEFQATNTGAVDYLIDGVTVYSIAIDGVAYFGNIDLEAMNAIPGFTNNTGDYAVTFSNIGYGTTPAPVSIPEANTTATIVGDATIGDKEVAILTTEQIVTVASTFTGDDRVLFKSLDSPVFLELTDDSHWTGSQSITLTGFTPSKVYQLYHYDDSGNITPEGTFDSDEQGNIEITLTAFSGNIIAETTATATPRATPLVPNTGFMPATDTPTHIISIAILALGATTILIIFIHARTRTSKIFRHWK